MKYRVKQVDDKFYPQYKRFLFWWDFKDFDVLNGLLTFIDKSLYYPTLEIAKLFIDCQIKCKHKKNKMVPTYSGLIVYFNFDFKFRSEVGFNKYFVYLSEDTLNYELERVNHKPKITYYKYESSN